jgi:hypothetical protein
LSVSCPDERYLDIELRQRTFDVIALENSPSVSIYATYESINAGFQLVNSSTYLSRRTPEFGRKLRNNTHSMSQLSFPRTKFSIHWGVLRIYWRANREDVPSEMDWDIKPPMEFN